MFHPSELPALAKYFDDCKQVVFDARYSIQMNDNHIFEDGVARGRLPKYQAEYERVKGNEMEKDLLLKRGQNTRWLCTVCGHVHDGAEPPEMCPVCGHDKGHFKAAEKITEV